MHETRYRHLSVRVDRQQPDIKSNYNKRSLSIIVRRQSRIGIVSADSDTPSARQSAGLTIFKYCTIYYLSAKTTGIDKSTVMRPDSAPAALQMRQTESAKKTAPWNFRDAVFDIVYRAEIARLPAINRLEATGTNAVFPILRSACRFPAYQAKWANALFASAIRWTISRRCMAVPSRL